MGPTQIQRALTLARKPDYGSVNVTRQNFSLLDIQDRGVNAQISAYGVGMKHAAFKIGDELTIISKTVDMDQVAEVSMSQVSITMQF